MCDTVTIRIQSAATTLVAMRGYAQASFGQVHYRHEGEAGPAVVCFHEAPMSSEIYGPALPVLGRSFRAYAFDTPGHGFSDKPTRQPTIEEYGRWLLEAIDDIGLERLIVVGCHTGADIGLEVARQAGPSRVTHAVLTGVPLMKPDEWEGYFERVLSRGWTGERPKSWSEYFAPDWEPTIDGAHMMWAWKRWASGKRSDYPIESTPIDLFQMAVLQLLIAGPHYNWMYRAAWKYDPEPALRGLECPVLLLNAGEDPLADKDHEVARLIRDARVLHLEGLTGQLPWRVPERFTSEIESFVGVGAKRPA
jgi:pimeloyl-ACP methyl ester carboxylesterase